MRFPVRKHLKSSSTLIYSCKSFFRSLGGLGYFHYFEYSETAVSPSVLFSLSLIAKKQNSASRPSRPFLIGPISLALLQWGNFLNNAQRKIIQYSSAVFNFPHPKCKQREFFIFTIRKRFS